jgi:hypothetical protein
MIEICELCHTPTDRVFCPQGHLAEVRDYEEHNHIVTGALYSCVVPTCAHSMNFYPGSGKSHLMLKQAFFNKHLGGQRSGRHARGMCPPRLTLQQTLQQMPPRNRRRSDRQTDKVDVAALVRNEPKNDGRPHLSWPKSHMAPVKPAANKIRAIMSTESPEVNFLRKLAPVEEIEAFLPAVRRWIPTCGAGMRLAKRIPGALDETGCPRPSFILAVAAACEELENRHQAN